METLMPSPSMVSYPEGASIAGDIPDRRTTGVCLVVLAALAIVLATAAPAAVEATTRRSTLASSGWTVAGPRLRVLAPSPSGWPDMGGVSQPTVVQGTNGSFLMYYTGYDGARNRILTAQSSDGIVWTKIPGSISLNDGAGSPFVMRIGIEYRMWFESVVWGSGPLGYTDRIYGATSFDGLNWTITGVVVDVGAGPAWDAGTVGDPWVVRASNGTYLMYFGMYAANRSVAIGVATSADLVTFTKWPGNPVLLPGPPGSWDDYSVSNPAVATGGSWAIFYGGRRAATKDQIGLASSSDGFHWTRTTGPFLGADTAGRWDSGVVGAPAIVKAGTNRLYYDGSNTTGGSGIGMVNLTVSTTGGGEGNATMLGIPLVAFLTILVLLAVGAAAVVVFAIMAGGTSRRRIP